MRTMKMTKSISIARLILMPMLALFLAVAAHAAVPGITGTGTVGTFNLTAQTAFLNQPDGSTVYSWGYGCNGTATFAPTLGGVSLANQNCPSMQVPGPTLVVTEGTKVTVVLTNGLPTSAGNTSILFPGFVVTATGGVTGLLTQEAAPAGTVTYTFTASSPGTHPYYSGTQSDLQIEMGLYGAVVVLPATIPSACSAGLPVTHPGNNAAAKMAWGESDFRLAAAALDTAKSCYDREYLFQCAEMDANLH
jgi:FtsP/CotA-like multicopper oxidase with cupredoxin domain